MGFNTYTKIILQWISSSNSHLKNPAQPNNLARQNSGQKVSVNPLSPPTSENSSGWRGRDHNKRRAPACTLTSWHRVIQTGCQEYAKYADMKKWVPV